MLDILPAAVVSWPTFLEPAALACTYVQLMAHGHLLSVVWYRDVLFSIIKESVLLAKDGG